MWFPRSNEPKQRSCLAHKSGILESDHIEIAIEYSEAAPANTEDAYLRLHLLSERQRQPNSMNLDGIFSLLTTVAWTSAGPVLPEQVDRLREEIAT